MAIAFRACPSLDLKGDWTMTLAVPPDYQTLDEQSLLVYLSRLPSVADRLGGNVADWRASEIGDGYLNFVFLVEGLRGKVCVKQAVPYVRLIGESWPMTLERMAFQHRCHLEHDRYCADYLPEVYHYDSQLYLIVMEYLNSHIIMRYGMIQAIEYPLFAEQMSEYLSRSLFFTSSFFLSSAEKKQKMAFFCDNTELCKILEDVVFTEPYWQAKNNRWTSPQLDEIAAEFRQDVPLKIAASRLKLKYMTNAEALIHGDLHTGSLMVTPESLKVIDHEYAFYGPMAFDVGNVIGNLLLDYLAQEGYATIDRSRETYQAWILDTIEQLWSKFYHKFIGLWEQQETCEPYAEELFADAAAREAMAAERRDYLQRLFVDAIGFAGVEMIRRILGLAHTIDLDGIEPPDRRSVCETACLRLGRELVVNAPAYATIEAVTAAARQVRQDHPLATQP